MEAKTKKILKNNIAGYLLITPLLISLIIFTIYPLLLALFSSFFTDYVPKRNGVYDWSTFGLQNYINAFHDVHFWKSLKITLIYCCTALPISIVLSFIIGFFLSKDFKGAKIYRVLYYLPCIIPGIVGAMVYKYIYSQETWGFFNTLLIAFGLDKSAFFEDKDQAVALISFISMGLFSIGGSSPFWIAGFKSISKTYYEAASLDGASSPRKLISITIPLMGKYIFFQVVTGVIGAFQIGQGVLAISSRGGYDGNLTFLGLLIYNQTQGSYGFNMGYASALSYILFIIIAGLSIFIFKENKKVYYEDMG